MTEYSNANTITDMLRTIISTFIDRPAFLLLCLMYEIFFNVAETELFSDATIRSFFYRIQLIIGVFMIFKLSISVLEAIVNPEKLTAKKTGTMSVIARVFISLALLAALTPINIPNPKNEYERKLKNNGLIFGVLYSLQHRILQQNTLGRLILGNEFSTSETDGKVRKTIAGMTYSDAANSFASTILKTFMRINLVPESERQTNDSNQPDELNRNNWVCKDIDSTIINTYRDVNADPQQLLSFVTYDCDIAENESSAFSWLKSLGKKLSFTASYAFTYNPLGGIAAIVFAFLLLTFTIDVAIRAIKIAVLRLIAPIPVISYMSPNPKDNGAMGTWAKSLMSTYIELFTRLLMVYLVIYLIQDIIHNGLVIGTSGGIIGGISFILICFGLFLFVKQAPKFIKDALGMKGNAMSNIGLNAALSGLGAARAGGTAHDTFAAARDSVDTGIQAYNQGKAAPGIGDNYNTGRDYAAKMITGDDKMTWKNMHRGQAQLAREGITRENADKLHDATLKASAFTKQMEADHANNVFTYLDDSGHMQNYKYAEYDADGNVIAVHDVTDKYEMAYALKQQREQSGILEAKDNKVDAELKKYGANPGYRDKKRKDIKHEPVKERYKRRASNFNEKYYKNPDVDDVSQAGQDIWTHH